VADNHHRHSLTAYVNGPNTSIDFISVSTRPGKRWATYEWIAPNLSLDRLWSSGDERKSITSVHPLGVGDGNVITLSPEGQPPCSEAISSTVLLAIHTSSVHPPAGVSCKVVGDGWGEFPEPRGV